MLAILRPSLLGIISFCLSVALGLAGIGLPMAGVGGFYLGLILSILSGLFFVVAVVAGSIWAWPYAKRLRVRSPFEFVSVGDDSSAKSWNESLLLTEITDATFEDQQVPLDGFSYDRCTFVRCTFAYKGEKPFTLTNFKVLDDWNVEAASPSLHSFSRLLNALKLIRKDVEVAKELEPTQPVAYGELKRGEEVGSAQLSDTEDLKQLRVKLRQVEQERDSLRTMSPEEVRILQHQRRERIEDWRIAVRNFDFGADQFAKSDTYSEMRPHLRTEVRNALEIPGLFDIAITAALVPRKQGVGRHKRMLLDEVTRIENKWGLI